MVHGISKVTRQWITNRVPRLSWCSALGVCQYRRLGKLSQRAGYVAIIALLCLSSAAGTSHPILARFIAVRYALTRSLIAIKLGAYENIEKMAQICEICASLMADTHRATCHHLHHILPPDRHGVWDDISQANFSGVSILAQSLQDGRVRNESGHLLARPSGYGNEATGASPRN